MLRKQIEHVIEEGKAGADARTALAVKVECHAHVSFFGLAPDACCARLIGLFHRLWSFADWYRVLKFAEKMWLPLLLRMCLDPFRVGSWIDLWLAEDDPRNQTNNSHK
jgi:hypothetical protein